MNVNKQTVVIVDQLTVISIKTPEKILQSICHVAIGSENVNKRKWAAWSLCSEQNQIDLRDLIGEKEHGTFWPDCSEWWKRTANFCSDRSEQCDLWKRTQPLSRYVSMCVRMCVCVCVCMSVNEGVSVDAVCIQLVVSVELLVSSVQLSGCLLFCPTSPSVTSSQIYDVHTHLVQTVKQLSRDVDIFWQVKHSNSWSLVNSMDVGWSCEAR